MKKINIFEVAFAFFILAPSVLYASGVYGDIGSYYEDAQGELKKPKIIYGKSNEPELILMPEKKKSEITATDKEIKEAKKFIAQLKSLAPYERYNGYFTSTILRLETENGQKLIKTNTREIYFNPKDTCPSRCFPPLNSMLLSEKPQTIPNRFSFDMVLLSELSVIKEALGKNLKVLLNDSLYNREFIPDMHNTQGVVRNAIAEVFKRFHEKQSEGCIPSKFDNKYFSLLNNIRDFLKETKVVELEFVPHNGFIGLETFSVPVYFFVEERDERKYFNVKKWYEFMTKLFKYMGKLKMKPVLKTIDIVNLNRFTITYMYRDDALPKRKIGKTEFLMNREYLGREAAILYKAKQSGTWYNLQAYFRRQNIPHFTNGKYGLGSEHMLIVHPPNIKLYETKRFEEVPENGTIISDTNIKEGHFIHYVVEE